MRKIIPILILTTLLLLGAAALLDPTIRYPFVGVQLSRDLSTLEGSDPVTVLLSVETGVELLPEDQLSDEPALQDEYSLLMILREEVKAQKESASATYTVEEMQSEQWAWQEVELNKLKARTQVYSSDLATAPTLSFPKESVMASTEVWTPLLTSLWPKLPKGFQKAGKSTWQEQLSYEEKNPISGELVKINYNLVYKLDKFINTDRGVLANIVVLGSIKQSSEADSSIDVRGTIKGFVLVEPESGRTYGGEYRIEEKFMVKQPALPVYRKSLYQGAKFWRPMFYKMSDQRPNALKEAGAESPKSPGAKL